MDYSRSFCCVIFRGFAKRSRDCKVRVRVCLYFFSNFQTFQIKCFHTLLYVFGLLSCARSYFFFYFFLFFFFILLNAKDAISLSVLRRDVFISTSVLSLAFYLILFHRIRARTEKIFIADSIKCAYVREQFL